MISMGIIAGHAVPAMQDMLVFPLTYDEQDSQHAITLARSVGSAPFVTPDGFEGDGYQARYKSSSLPAWVNSGPFSLQASVAAPSLKARSTRDEIVSLCMDDADAAVRLGLAIRPDEKGDVLAPNGALMLSSGAQSALLGRPGWKYQFRTPHPTVGGYSARPQALHFMDEDTLLFSVHLEDTESVVYRVRLSDKSITGQFSFGTSTYRHVASIASRTNGDVWVGDYETGRLLQLDVDASFASGSAVILATCNSSNLGNGIGAIAFKTIAGVEYLLQATYDTVDTNAFLYLFPVAVLASANILVTDRYKRFSVGRRIQGIAPFKGNLLLSRNNLYSATSPAGVVGWVQELNVDGMAASLADNAVVRASQNGAYVLREAVGPSSYVEDISIHPSTGEVFIATEGGYSVGDQPGFLGVWSGSLAAGDTELNHYTAEYDGASTVVVKVNGFEFATLPWTIDQAANVLTIGGLPAAAPGFTSGYALGFIASVALVNGPVDAALYQNIADGSFEPNALTVYSIALTNPGAESGSTAGWTVESGGMAVRSANPPPFAGSFYFTGGNFASSVSRQRVPLSGVPSGTIDSGAAWAKIRWQQCAYSDQDPGAMGVRSLTAADASLGTIYAPSGWTPFGGGATGPWYWYPRNLPAEIPANTRKLDALYNASGRTSGTANDFYVDNVSLTVYGR